MSDLAARPAPVRVGIVGAGSWAALAHIPAVLAHPNASLAGVADRDPERLAMTADHHGVRERYADHRELIASGGLDALVVATPHATHYEVARDALDAGLHVLVEKPMTVRAADAKDLDARARAAGLHLVVGYTNQFAPGAIAARSLVQRGELGEITLVSGLFTSGLEDILTGFPSEDSSYAKASPIGGPGAATYADPARSGGGQGQSQATHALGMLAWITGLRARRVAALMSNRGAPVDLIDAIVYELENGAIGTLAATGALGARQHEQQEQHYYGTQGTLRQDFITGAVTLFPRAGGPPRELAPTGPGEAEAAFSAPLDCLVGLIRGTSENGAPASAGIAAVELLEAAYRSAAGGGAAVVVPD
jgi:predicted dehydrogenase